MSIAPYPHFFLTTEFADTKIASSYSLIKVASPKQDFAFIDFANSLKLSNEHYFLSHSTIFLRNEHPHKS